VWIMRKLALKYTNFTKNFPFFMHQAFPFPFTLFTYSK